MNEKSGINNSWMSLPEISEGISQLKLKRTETFMKESIWLNKDKYFNLFSK